MRRAPRSLVMITLLALLALAVGLLAACGGSSDDTTASPSAGSDVTTKAYKIGITQIVSHPALDATVQGFKDALAAKGFTNVTYVEENAQGDIATAASIAQKLASEDLDLILTVATPTSQSMVKVDKETPIVFTAVTDPKGAGLVADPAAPDANVTGVSDMQPVEPILELATQLKPGITKVGVIYSSGEVNSVFLVDAEKVAAEAMGLEIVEATAAKPAEVSAAAESLVGRVDAITVIGDNTAVTALESIVKVCNENGILLLAGDSDSVKRGAVASYGFDYADLGMQSGDIAARILGGTPVTSIPVEFAQNLQLSVNEAAAKAQGVTLPADLVAEAVNKY
jgi:putative ABC transport system substrate-binding protein